MTFKESAMAKQENNVDVRLDEKGSLIVQIDKWYSDNGQWHHLCVQVVRGRVTVFIDNEEKNIKSSSEDALEDV